MAGLLDVDWRLILFICAGIGATVLIAHQFEKTWPAEPNQSRSEVIADFKLVFVASVMGWITRPVVAMSSVALVNAAGGGLFVLRADTVWDFAVSLAVFLVATDLYSYWSHRLSHAVPALWAMHSLHHSAEALTFITGARHLWLETAIMSAFFPVIAVLFKTPPVIVMTVLFLGFLPNGCAHLNVRLHLGRFSTWINGPQWHRIHHSIQREHLNRNYAAIFPIWDILFGTAWIPAENEFPPSGLVPSERPGIVDGIIWPVRTWRWVDWSRRMIAPARSGSGATPQRERGSMGNAALAPPTAGR
jgi:sterol desaturase/sphingolipid hydroxylase (fatty acid hydroxylase superfamily)